MNDSTSPSEGDFKPGDQVMWGKIGPCGVAAVDGGMVWVRLPSGGHSTVLASALSLVAAHPIPSEPNTAWVDKYGHDIWLVNHAGDIACVSNISSNPEKYTPFTRLVPEGSEREAAIREVVEWLKGFTCIKCDQGIKQVERHFLSVVDQ